MHTHKISFVTLDGSLDGDDMECDVDDKCSCN